jgi:TDG/mug DNA glycosylase family protein
MRRAEPGVALSGLPRTISTNTSVLILGTFPGTESLAARQYYKSDRNRFWTVMQYLLQVDMNVGYPERLAALSQRGIGLWDVLQSCQREGALDARIVQGTEVPNNFATFFARYAAVRIVCFNGKNAEQMYRRHVCQRHTTADPLEWVTLPSTSPVNTRYGIDRLCERWSVVRVALDVGC